MVSWLLAVALGGDPPPRIDGFDRLLTDPVTLEIAPATRSDRPGPDRLVLENGHTARAVPRIDGVAIGELLPRQVGTIHGVPPGTYVVTWDLGDVVRTERVPSRPESDDAR